MRSALLLLALLSCIPLAPAQARLSLTYTSIDFPGAFNTAAFGLNDGGDIVGTYDNSSHGFLLSQGVFTTIDFPGAIYSSAYGINNLGQIVGSYRDSNGVTHGFLYSSGQFSTVDVPGAILTIPWGINASGDIAGDFSDGVTLHGFTYIGGTFATVDVAGAKETVLAGINDAREVSGAYCKLTCSGLVIKNSIQRTVHYPGATWTEMLGISNSLQIAGIFQRGKREGGFIFIAGRFFNVIFPGASLTIPNAFNSGNQVIGTYDDADGTSHGFLASP